MDDEVLIACPYCWLQVSVTFDLGLARQSLVQDCDNCCNPIEVELKFAEGYPQVVSVSKL